MTKIILAAFLASAFLVSLPARAADPAPAPGAEKAEKGKKEKKDDKDKKKDEKAGGGW